MNNGKQHIFFCATASRRIVFYHHNPLPLTTFAVQTIGGASVQTIGGASEGKDFCPSSSGLHEGKVREKEMGK